MDLHGCQRRCWRAGYAAALLVARAWPKACSTPAPQLPTLSNKIRNSKEKIVAYFEGGLQLRSAATCCTCNAPPSAALAALAPVRLATAARHPSCSLRPPSPPPRRVPQEAAQRRDHRAVRRQREKHHRPQRHLRVHPDRRQDQCAAQLLVPPLAPACGCSAPARPPPGSHPSA
jgi:hypothetical protein